MAQLVAVSDGNHFSISKDFVDEGIPYYRGQDVTGRFFIESASPNFITEDAFNRAYMKRSHLKKGDVLLSIIGTIGELSLVDSENNATCSCKLAIFRPHSIEPEFLAAFLQCEHGNNQIRRLTRGAVQQGFLLEDVDQLLIPDFSDAFRGAVVSAVQGARQAQLETQDRNRQAESLLLGALGLTGWTPPDPLTYSERASALRIAERMDAEYFDPRHLYAEELIANSSFKTLGELAEFVSSGPAWPSDQFTNPDDPEGLPFVRIRNCKPGTIETERLDRLLPDGISKFSSAMAAPGDIVIGMDGLRWFYAGLLGGGAYINQRVGWVRMSRGSPKSNYVQLVINGVLGQAQLLRRMTIANTVGHITLNDIRDIKIPTVSEERQQAITSKLEESVSARNRSRILLGGAKHAVEIAIEEGEAAALAYLAKAVESANG